jgi:hypothetical protein
MFMSDYENQLEEANERLTKSLERETMLRELERNRHKRWYRVEIHHINNTHLDKAAAGNLCPRYPEPLNSDEVTHAYDIPGMVAVRAVILSHLFMRQRDDGSLLGAGISWSAYIASRHNSDGSWNPSSLLRKGWIVNSIQYPGWGGNFVNYWNPDKDSPIPTRYKNYGEYARFAMGCHTKKLEKV